MDLPVNAGRSTFSKGLFYTQNFVFGVISLAVASVAIHQCLPVPSVPAVSAKLQRLQEIRDQVTALFVGSSLVHRQIDPTLFDSILHAHGQPSRSFNLGIDGMRSLETDFLLRKVVQQGLPALRWVFVEAIDFSLEVPPKEAGTIRSQYWHDLTGTAPIMKRLGARFIAGGRAKRKVPKPDTASVLQRRLSTLKTMGTHLGLMLRNYANLGRGLELTSAGRIERDNLLTNPEWSDTGFLSIHRELPPADAQRLHDWTESSAGERQRPIDASHIEALQRIRDRLRARGVTAILLVTPDAGVERDARRLAFATGIPVLAFNDPTEYPVLYQPENRYNVRHLNAKGAREFTKVVADEFLRRIKANE